MKTGSQRGSKISRHPKWAACYIFSKRHEHSNLLFVSIIYMRTVCDQLCLTARTFNAIAVAGDKIVPSCTARSSCILGLK